MHPIIRAPGGSGLEQGWRHRGEADRGRSAKLRVEARVTRDRTVVYEFGDIEIDLGVHEVRRAGAAVPVEPQVFDVLAHLLEHRERTVTKEQLLDAVWGNRFVSESALTSRIKAARRAVGDDGRTQAIIRTVHGRGYRFVAH